MASKKHAYRCQLIEHIGLTFDRIKSLIVVGSEKRATGWFTEASFRVLHWGSIEDERTMLQWLTG
jgi:hypothetical protein